MIKIKIHNNNCMNFNRNKKVKCSNNFKCKKNYKINGIF